MRYYDGSMKWERIEGKLRDDGYQQEFACTYGAGCPINFTGSESGWQMRRMIKSYCAGIGIEDYKIVRNTSYHKDLHGPAVYELWTRAAARHAA